MSVAHALLPQVLDAGLPQRPRAPRARHGDPRRGHRRACGSSRRSPARTRTCAELPRDHRPLPPVEPADGRPERRSTSRSSTCSRRSRSRSCSATAAICYFAGALTIGTLFAFMLYVQNFFDPVQELSQLYGTFLSATAALDKIIGGPRRAARGARPRRARATSPRSRGDVRFEGVRFAYGRGDEVLHGIDLDVAAGHDRRARRPHRRGQVDDREAARALLRPDHGRITIDGVDLRDVTPGLAPPPARGRAAGGLPLRRHACATTSPSASPTRRRRDRRRRAGGRRARLHHAARGRLRDRARRARLAALARPAPARRLRAGAARRPAHPDPRRGDVVGRHRHRAQDRARAATPARRPDRVRDRPPPLDDPRRRPDRRARARPHRRAGHA